MSAELKQELRDHGLADPYSRVECLEIVDECFNCGEKLTTPYVYWQGATGNLSLHPKCAAKLALCLGKDSFSIQMKRDVSSDSEAASALTTLS